MIFQVHIAGGAGLYSAFPGLASASAAFSGLTQPSLRFACNPAHWRCWWAQTGLLFTYQKWGQKVGETVMPPTPEIHCSSNDSTYRLKSHVIKNPG